MAHEIQSQTSRHEFVIGIDEHITIPYMSLSFTGFAHTPPVFVAAFLVAMVESTCADLIKARFGYNQRSACNSISLSLCAPVLVGVALRVAVELIDIQGDRLSFEFTCCDETAVVARGKHERDLVG